MKKITDILRKFGIKKISDLWNLKIILHAIKLFIKSNFFRYLITGVIVTIISTALLWFFVDILHLYAYIMSAVLAVLIFFLKFIFHTNILKIFNNSKDIFFKYALITLVLVLLTSFLLWIFVDTLKFSVIIVNPIVTVFTFVLRFYLFSLFDMLVE